MANPPLFGGCLDSPEQKQTSEFPSGQRRIRAPSRGFACELSERSVMRSSRSICRFAGPGAALCFQGDRPAKSHRIGAGLGRILGKSALASVLGSCYFVFLSILRCQSA